VAALSATAFAANPDRIDRAREQVLGDDFQREIPHAGELATPSTGTRDSRVIIADGGDEEQAAPGPLGTVLNVLMWGLVIVGGALATFWIAIELVKFGDADAELAEPPRPDTGPDLAVIERPLGDAEEHARRGDYAGAIHTLLLRTLQELVRANALRVPPALTSREILARVPLQPDARTALAELITSVEVTHFGSDPATADDYARCRGHFERFATAFRGHA
jgi:hypothetical protein